MTSAMSDAAANAISNQLVHNQDATDFWTFKICDLKSCKQHYNHGYPSKDLHLIIERQEVGREELLANPGQYFAISYTWGKLPFKKHYLGHSPDGDRAFVLELGQEWDRKGVVETLARLSCGEENTGGVKLRAGWLDQFRTRNQKRAHEDEGSEVQTKVLNLIPTIYEKCEVFALFPGRPCECVRATLSDRKIERGSEPVLTELSECLNFIDLISWWGRLWPRQEFMYAKRISVKWTSQDGNAKCVPVSWPLTETGLTITQFRTLTKLCQLHFEEFFWLQARARRFRLCSGACQWFMVRNPVRALEVLPLALARDRPSFPDTTQPRARNEICPCRLALERFRAYQTIYYETMKLSLSQKFDETNSTPRIRDFLNGDRIETPGWKDADQEQRTLERFNKSLGLLGRSHRQATQAKDIVGAVWPECPKYKYRSPLPDEDYTTLLEDAIGQVQSKFGRALITTAPYALFADKPHKFENHANSWSWKPSKYLAPEPSKDTDKPGGDFPRTTSYVYGPTASPFSPVPIKTDQAGRHYLALQLTGSPNSRPTPLSRGAKAFEERFPAQAADTPADTARAELESVRDFLKDVVQKWPRYVLDRCHGPEFMVLHSILRQKKLILLGTVLPLFVEEKAWAMATHSGLLLRKFLTDKKLQKKIVVKIVGKKFSKQVLKILFNIRDGVQKSEEAMTEIMELPVSELRKLVLQVTKSILVAKTLKRIERTKQSRPYQTMRDQRFLDGIVHSSPEDRGDGQQTGESTLVGTCEAAIDRDRLDAMKDDEHRVNHIDAIYYLVAEALGIRPLDIGMDYNESWSEKGLDASGKAYQKSSLKLMVSGGSTRMLGFTRRDPHALSRAADDGNVMTVAYLEKETPTDGNRMPAGAEEAKSGNCLYEVERMEGEDAWWIVAVWVPINCAPDRFCSGWFGKGAEAQVKLR